MPRRTSVPPYPSKPHNGQARITLRDGPGRRRDVTLGKFDSPESHAEYAKVIAEWLANSQRLPQSAAPAAASLTVSELLLDYKTWAERHYRDEEGKPGRELENLQAALRPLRQLYGHTPAQDFGPLALRAVRDEMIRAGLCRKTVNARINRIRRVFKWASSFQKLPAAVHQALKDVPGLQYGRDGVRESDPVESVPAELVEAALPFMPAPVAAMVRLQMLNACRPGEVMRMRAADLKTCAQPWEYHPPHHKNKHRGLKRIIHLGAQAQEIIKPFLTTDLEAYLFSPRAYVEALHVKRAAGRKSKRTPSQLARKRKAKPKRKPAERYNRRSYRLAVVRACDKAFPPPEHLRPRPLPNGKMETAKAWWARLTTGEKAEVCAWRKEHRWNPLRVRHTAATFIQTKYGIEATRVICGHARVETTQIYAERDLAKSRQIMAEIG